MDTYADKDWVSMLAIELVKEITEEMSEIKLRPVPSHQKQVEMDGVCGRVDGDYRIRLQFRAEPRLFHRLAKNMIGDEPADFDEVREYAVEYFNVLCGRFIAEIHRSTKSVAGFFPTHYEDGPELNYLKDLGALESIPFISDEDELAEFVWTKIPLKEV